LAAAGAAVVVNYASSKAGAERVVADITGKGGEAIAVHGNVAEAKDAQASVRGDEEGFSDRWTCSSITPGSLSSVRSRP